jgi:hypothetical protein
MNHLPGLALNHDLPDLCLLSSQDYPDAPPAPGDPIYSLWNALPHDEWFMHTTTFNHCNHPVT